ncbi:EAL domain-containing protein [Frankia sp. R82]|uniref:sensor domain-containing phosphodiesterase n=1 Tax=Frankia sp. R82 TaxID=2950553 RepID=UPI0020437F43|nr:EAL domain-containing protein [Frankia sp. R82]MCM3885626.1 EAL domain-containing protein [Frankia sp. R82]
MVTCLGPRARVRAPSTALVELLELLRRRLHMEAAWLGRLDGDLLVLQVISGRVLPPGLMAGSTVRREQGMFHHVLSGRLPNLIPDTLDDPRTASMAPVYQLGVRAYAATPVLDADGRTYGLVGCLSRQPQPLLGDQELRLLNLLASLLTGYVTDLHRMWESRSRIWRHIQEVMADGAPYMHFQPIVDLHSGRTIAVEALSRFCSRASPEAMFVDAAQVGLGPELELTAVDRALAALPLLPPGIRLAVNASPSIVTDQLADRLLYTGCPQRLILEITEREYIADDDDDLFAVVDRLRAHGVRIALDDVGTGYAGLGVMLCLRPDIIKLDRIIVRDMAHSPAHAAVAAGMARIADGLGSTVVAEGIEHPADLDAVLGTSIGYGQGFLLGGPCPDPAHVERRQNITRSATRSAGRSIA